METTIERMTIWCEGRTADEDNDPGISIGTYETGRIYINLWRYRNNEAERSEGVASTIAEAFDRATIAWEREHPDRPWRNPKSPAPKHEPTAAATDEDISF